MTKSQPDIVYLVSVSSVEGLEDGPQYHWVKLPPGDGKSPQHTKDESVENKYLDKDSHTSA